MDAWLWALVLVIAGMLLLLLAGWWLARRLSADARSLVERIGRLPWRAKARLVWALLRDRRISILVRALIPALILYLALPFDLIPDFIPLLGQLDDVMVVLLVVGLVLRATPRAVLEEQLERLEGGHPAPSAGR